MTDVRIKCPMCGASIKVAERFVGKRGRCPKCGEEFAASTGLAIREKPADVDFDMRPALAELPTPVAPPPTPVAPPPTIVMSAVLIPAAPRRRPNRWLVPAGLSLGVLAGVVGLAAWYLGGRTSDPQPAPRALPVAAREPPKPEPEPVEPVAVVPPRPKTVGEMTVNDLTDAQNLASFNAATAIVTYLGPENTGDITDEKVETTAIGDAGIIFTFTGRIEYTAENRASPSRYRYSVTVVYDVAANTHTVDAAKVGTKVIK